MAKQESPALWGRSRPDGDLVLVDRRLYAIRPRRRRLWLGVGGVLLILLGVLLAARGVWLAALKDWLIYRQAPQPAGAIIVLGGGSGERSALGAQLYHEGYAPRVVTSYVERDTLCMNAAPMRRLVNDGVPAGDVYILHNPLTTYAEAQMARALFAAQGWDIARVLLVTDNFHSRRAHLIFSEMLPEVEVISVPSEPAWFRQEAWWEDDDTLRSVVTEYLKFIWFYLDQRGRSATDAPRAPLSYQHEESLQP